MYLLLFVLNIMVLLSIAFFTLFERKILGYLQLRLGPSKMSVKGILQPIIDGLKLFMKESYLGLNLSKFMYSGFPFFLLLLMLLFWLSFIYAKVDYLKHSMIYVILVSSLGVYGVMGSGWSSNSKYALLGAYRSVCQVISYEVGMVFIIMLFFIYLKSYSMSLLLKVHFFSHYFFFGFLFMFLIWVVTILAELNRSPFDFSESESELVSGFNIEYGSLKFAFLFLSEYGNMIFMGLLSVYIFFMNEISYLLIVLLLMVWVRGSFPRFRYDNLMYLSWKVFLPLILLFYFYVYLMVVF
uniref:NADH dehydrogenase subunit 1 n=1 Tax=Neoseiulus chebalingensis TaxID=3061192 RepID=UPI0030FE6F48